MAVRNITQLPSDLTFLLFNLGTRRLVLVEGPSDCDVLREWYRDNLGDIEFYPAGGGSEVRRLLALILNQSSSPTPREFGIIDRDFSSDIQVEDAANDATTHLFILRRYAIENYLLEPIAVAAEVQTLLGVPLLDAQVESNLLDLCSELCSMMAANWVFIEAGTGKHYNKGHDIVFRIEVVQRVARELSCSEVDADQRLTVKEAVILPLLQQLDAAYTRINGKHLFFRIRRTYFPTGLDDAKFRRLLARSVKERVGIHADIRNIIENRILASPV